VNRSSSGFSDGAARFALLALLVVGCSPATPNPPASVTPSAVLDRERQRIEYLTTGAYDQLDAMTSPTLTYTHSNGTLDDRQRFMEELRNGNVVYRSLDHHDLAIRFLGDDVAILNGISDVGVTIAGADAEVPLRVTIIYARRDGEWLFEAWHSARRQE
jgi:hypothetical protein